MHTSELKKFTSEEAEIKDFVHKVRAWLDMWTAFLIRHDLLEHAERPISLDTPRLEKAMHVLEVMNFSQEERECYEDHLKWLRIAANMKQKA